jgi:hypothetical protein
MASDAIFFRCGFDGNESDNVLAPYRTYAKLGVRFTFAINTFYPEVFGGHFENRALYELIAGSLRCVGLSPVREDYYSPLAEWTVPAEGLGQILMDENYALVYDDGSQGGMLLVWCYHAGGGGTYYADKVIFDFVLPQPMMDIVVRDVEQKCREVNVRFSCCTPAAVKPVDVQPEMGWLKRLLDVFKP